MSKNEKETPDNKLTTLKIEAYDLERKIEKVSVEHKALIEELQNKYVSLRKQIEKLEQPK